MSARREARAAREAEAVQSTRRARKEKSLWHYLAAGISAGLLLLVVVVGVLVIIVPMLTGSQALTVLTSSMRPTYPEGTLIIVQPTDIQQLRIGDPITYQQESGAAVFVTHRIVSISRSTDGTTTLITKGDNNPSPDRDPVYDYQVVGKVWYSLPWIGYLNNAVGGQGRSWIVIAAAVLLFGYAGWQFISSLRGRKAKGEDATAQSPAP